MKITIHRALAELKLLEARIAKKTTNLAILGWQVKGKLVNSRVEKEKFDTNAKADYNSILDMIKRKAEIKAAINVANIGTSIKIGSVEMTISEAITMKAIIEQRRNLLKRMEANRSTNNLMIERNNQNVEQRALGIAQTALGKDGLKINDTDVKNIITPYMEMHEYILVDPLGADDLIKELDSEIGEFEMDIDATLSEINATTTIEISE